MSKKAGSMEGTDKEGKATGTDAEKEKASLAGTGTGGEETGKEEDIVKEMAIDEFYPEG